METEKQESKMDAKYEITKHYGVIRTTKGGWTMELNEVRWNDHAPRLDIRCWCHEKGICGKGVSFNHEDIDILIDLLKLTI